MKRYTELLTKINEWKKLVTIDTFLDAVSKLCGENAVTLRKRIEDLSSNFEFQEVGEEFAVQFARYLAIHLLNVISFNEETIEEGKVRVMTCHSAKGLSGKLVILASCVDGLLPRVTDDEDQQHLDEQRRLFYVALTRCKYTMGGFPGRLIISSFVGIQNGQKLSLGIKTKKPGVNASRFIMEEISTKILSEAQLGIGYLDSIKNN